MDGVVLIDKPSGVTSFDVVRAVRRAAGERKVGHSGTLDPMASGLLVIALGQGTKLVPYLMESEKRYVGKVALGAATDTDDALGEIVETDEVPPLDETGIRKVLEKFVGQIEQVPPDYSALKQGGEPLYRKARRGEKVSPGSRTVEITQIELLEFSELEFVIDVRCKKGTYIRSLARDMAIELGTRGHLKELRRTESSGFDVQKALPLDSLDPYILKENILSLKDALPSMPKLELDEEDEARVKMGQVLRNVEDGFISSTRSKHFRLLRQDGQLLAIGLIENEIIRPIRMIV